MLKRPSIRTKETWYTHKRDLVCAQKRPGIRTKETWYTHKRDLRGRESRILHTRTPPHLAHAHAPASCHPVYDQFITVGPMKKL